MGEGPVSAAVHGLCRGLAGGAADRHGLRQQALARDLLSALGADAIEAFRHALLRLLDLEQPRTIDRDLGVVNVVHALRLGFVDARAHFVLGGQRAAFDVGPGIAKLFLGLALELIESQGQGLAISGGQMFHGNG